MITFFHAAVRVFHDIDAFGQAFHLAALQVVNGCCANHSVRYGRDSGRPVLGESYAYRTHVHARSLRQRKVCRERSDALLAVLLHLIKGSASAWVWST